MGKVIRDGNSVSGPTDIIAVSSREVAEHRAGPLPVP